MAQITVNELAEQLETTPRTARKFLRTITPKEEQPGKGKRWQIQKRDVRGLVKKFATFEKEHMRQIEEELEADTETE
jgi:predicted ArsR family transcriptional regulator